MRTPPTKKSRRPGLYAVGAVGALSLWGAALVTTLAGCQDGGQGSAEGGVSDAGGGTGGALRFSVVRAPQVGAPNLFGLYALGPDSFIAVGSRGTILRAAPPPLDAGLDPTGSDTPPPLEFTPLELPADLPRPYGELPDVMAVSGTGPNEIYAVTLGGQDPVTKERLGGVLLRFDGQRWQREPVKDQKGMPAVMTADLFGVYAYKGGAFAVGQGGAWLRRTATGWVTPPIPPAADAPPQVESLSDVLGTGAGDVFAVGGNGAAYRFDGARWAGASPDGFTGKLGGLFGAFSATGAPAPGSDIYAVGLGGALLKRSGARLIDYGVRADGRCGGERLPRVFLRHGAVTPGGQVVVVGWEGAILRLREGPCRDGGMGLSAYNESGVTGSRLEAVLVQKNRRPSGDRTTLYIAGAEGLILRAEWSEP